MTFLRRILFRYTAKVVSVNKKFTSLFAWSAVIFFFLLFYYEYIFFSHNIEILVIKNDAAEECYPRRTLLFGSKRRSSTPELKFAGFCGAIFTDFGDYTLPKSYEIWGVHQGRAFLQRNLIEGCRYEVTVVGYGGKFQAGDKPRYPIRQQITWINRNLGCAAS